MAISKKTLATGLPVIGVIAAFFAASAMLENAELDTQAEMPRRSARNLLRL